MKASKRNARSHKRPLSFEGNDFDTLLVKEEEAQDVEIGDKNNENDRSRTTLRLQSGGFSPRLDVHGIGAINERVAILISLMHPPNGIRRL